MTPNKSAHFRTALRQELPAWVLEGIVTETAAQKLTARYELEHAGKESSRLLAAVLFTLGGLLIGGGVISFVAANWEDLPTFAKVILLLAVLLGFQLGGYWLWHKKDWPRLGHALVFTGSLVFGANIGLMAQIFHVSGEWYGAFGAWAVGALALAFAARSWLTGVLALGTALLWLSGFAGDYRGNGLAVFPFLLAAVFLPLAWRLRSRVLYVLTFAGLTYAMEAVVLQGRLSGRVVLLTLVVGGFLAWAAGEFQRVKNIRPEFGNPTAALGMALLTVTAYLGSFHYWWEESNWWSGSAAAGKWAWVIPVAAAALAGVGLIAAALRQEHAHPARWQLQAGVMAAAALLSACALLGGNNSKGVVLFTLAANVAALLLAAVAIGSGILDERRKAFWVGALLLVLLISSRFLEYETSLLLKAAAFMACGAAVMAAGVAYERFLRTREALQ